MEKFFKNLLLVIAVILLAGVFYTSSSFAQVETEVSEAVTPTLKREKPINAKERIQNAREKNQELKEKKEARVTEMAIKKDERLSEARLKICEAREKNIGNRVSAMKKRSEVIFKGHEKIYQRVDEFYNNKLVPNGYILSNYADLKAEVAANKENVNLAMEAAKTSGEEFDCSATDPKGQVDAFQEDMKALIEANKAYKDSIHTFVKAVRDLAKTVTPIKVSPTITTEVTP
ncbi:MAG: hypothetical protein KBD51_02490 [Candidatus Levybacteria bacterium]|nr:hypothetical protein [Candidatus Levybacteria bacterium]